MRQKGYRGSAHITIVVNTKLISKISAAVRILPVSVTFIPINLRLGYCQFQIAGDNSPITISRDGADYLRNGDVTSVTGLQPTARQKRQQHTPVRTALRLRTQTPPTPCTGSC
jgi:hypothetical protein